MDYTKQMGKIGMWQGYELLNVKKKDYVKTSKYVQAIVDDNFVMVLNGVIVGKLLPNKVAPDHTRKSYRVEEEKKVEAEAIKKDIRFEDYTTVVDQFFKELNNGSGLF